MNPDDLRKINIGAGRIVGLFGDWNAPSTWSHDELVKATLASYIVIELRHTWEKTGLIWDAAVVATLSEPLQTIGIETNEEIVVNELLLIQRYFDAPWDDDITVHVYGIRKGNSLGMGPLRRDVWEPRTVWLSAAAIMVLEDGAEPSHISRLLACHKEVKLLAKKMESGVITESEYNREKKRLEKSYNIFDA